MPLQSEDAVKCKSRCATRANDAPGCAGSESGKLTLVDVGGVGLLPGLGALLLVTGGSGGLLASLLLLSGSLAGRGLAAGGGSLLGLGGHFGGVGGCVRLEKLEYKLRELGCDGDGGCVGGSRDGGRKCRCRAGTRYLWRARCVL